MKLNTFLIWWGAEMIDYISEFSKLILPIMQMVALIYAGYKFTRKPQDTLEDRQDALEKQVNEQSVKIKEFEESLHHGNDKFREQGQEIKILKATFKSVVLSFVNFEVAYCMHTGYEHTEELLKAKAEIEKYLSSET